MSVEWEALFSDRMGRMHSSAIRDLLHWLTLPGMISFAGGLPAAELFPIEDMRAALDYVMTTDGQAALQYGPTEGYLPLKEWLVERMARRGIPATPETTLITNGSQQGLDLIAKAFLNRGDVVVIERPSYVGGLQAFDSYEADYASVPTDDDGMVVDRLEEVLRARKPKLVYVLPNFQNPSGVTLSGPRRRQLVEVCQHYQVGIIEDDPYGEIRFEGEDLPPVKSFDTDGRVMYLGTFSKIFAPGTRLGWVVAPPEVMQKLVLSKQATDLHTDSLTQRAVYQYCKTGKIEQHIPRIRETYRVRRQAMVEAMERHFPQPVEWTRPQGGLFLWVHLPEEISADELLREAVEQLVCFVPGSAFFPHGQGQPNTFRLNYSNQPPERIEEGIRRLGVAIKKRLSSPTAAVGAASAGS